MCTQISDKGCSLKEKHLYLSNTLKLKLLKIVDGCVFSLVERGDRLLVVSAFQEFISTNIFLRAFSVALQSRSCNANFSLVAIRLLDNNGIGGVFTARIGWCKKKNRFCLFSPKVVKKLMIDDDSHRCKRMTNFFNKRFFFFLCQVCVSEIRSRTWMLRLGPQNSHWWIGLNSNLYQYFFSEQKTARFALRKVRERRGHGGAVDRKEGARGALVLIALARDVKKCMRPPRLPFLSEVLCLEKSAESDWWPHMWRHNQMSPISSNGIASLLQKRARFWE